MKTTLRISLLLNVVLFGGVIFLLTSHRKQAASLAPVSPEIGSHVRMQLTPPVSSATAVTEPASFRWSQLVSAKDYQTYIANLRAIGCPEPTIEDIVRGDAARAFSWERKQLALDGSGDGPWSRSRELQLVASLLGAQPPIEIPALAQSAKNPTEVDIGGEVAQASVPDTQMESPSYPLFLQNANWSALGFSAEERAVITQVRQQFQSEIGSLNQNADDAANQYAGTTSADSSSSSPNPNGPAALTRWQKALQDANQQLHDLLGAQAYMTYEQQQYYAWYQPQAAAAATRGEGLSINPAAFSLK